MPTATVSALTSSIRIPNNQLLITSAANLFRSITAKHPHILPLEWEWSSEGLLITSWVDKTRKLLVDLDPNNNELIELEEEIFLSFWSERKLINKIISELDAQELDTPFCFSIPNHTLFAFQQAEFYCSENSVTVERGFQLDYFKNLLWRLFGEKAVPVFLQVQPKYSSYTFCIAAGSSRQILNFYNSEGVYEALPYNPEEDFYWSGPIETPVVFAESKTLRVSWVRPTLAGNPKREHAVFHRSCSEIKLLEQSFELPKEVLSYVTDCLKLSELPTRKCPYKVERKGNHFFINYIKESEGVSYPCRSKGYIHQSGGNYCYLPKRGVYVLDFIDIVNVLSPKGDIKNIQGVLLPDINWDEYTIPGREERV